MQASVSRFCSGIHGLTDIEGLSANVAHPVGKIAADSAGNAARAQGRGQPAHRATPTLGAADTGHESIDTARGWRGCASPIGD